MSKQLVEGKLMTNCDSDNHSVSFYCFTERIKNNVMIWILFSLYLIGLYLTFSGFFPLGDKITSQSNRNLEEIRKELIKNSKLENYFTTVESNYTPKINKIVFILIDALGSMRFDNALNNDASLLSSIHNRKDNFIWFTSYAHAPTVTLPKLRSLVNGQMSNFVDVVMNVVTEDHSTQSDDGGSDKELKRKIVNSSGFLYNLKRLRDWKILLHGDETWFRLVSQSESNIFQSRSDSTHSLYVTDTIIVDNNVTRHIFEEMEMLNSWDLMILHYLGFDHLGHMHASEVEFKEKFQYYNDQVFEPILSRINDTLFIIGSDHGMTNDGNHGGSTPMETNAILAFIHPSIQSKERNYRGTVNQIDFCPTISLLAGVSIPELSVGKIILDLFLPFGEQFTLSSIIHNAAQLLKNVNEQEYNEFLKKWESVETNHSNRTIQIENYFKLLSEMSTNLIKKSGSIQMGAVFTGLTFLTIFSSFLVFLLYKNNSLRTFNFSNDYLFVGMIFIHLASYGSSSLIEEEHHIWYYFAAFTLIYIFAKLENNKWIFVMLVLDSITRNWNVSGIKDSQYLESQTSKKEIIEMTSFLVAFIVMITHYWKHESNTRKWMKGLLIAPCIVAWCYVLDFKLLESQLGLSDRINIVLVNVGSSVIALMIATILRTERIISFILFSIVWFLNEHTCNYPLILISIIQVILLNHVMKIGHVNLNSTQTKRLRRTNILTDFSKLFICQIFAYSCYFRFGRSISIANIDFSIAYQGLTFYHPLLIGFSLFVKIYAPRMIFEIFSTIEMENDWAAYNRKGNKFNVQVYHLLLRAVKILMSGFILLLMQNHLFVWSVFSPKFLLDSTLETLYHSIIFVVISLSL